MVSECVSECVSIAITIKVQKQFVCVHSNRAFICVQSLFHSHTCISSLTAPTALFLFLLRFLFSHRLSAQFHSRSTGCSEVGIRVEVSEAASHVESSSHVHSFLRLVLLLCALIFDDALGKNAEYFVHTLAGLGARSEMLTSHTHCIPKFTLIQIFSFYLSASSIGICLFGMSHLFPVMMIGVSGGRYICSSLTHLETLLHDSRSVMSYTINAPKLDIKCSMLY